MAVLIVLAVLLTINMLLMHFDRLVQFYFFLYRKIFKPKFISGETVFIYDEEYVILSESTYEKPYTYLCKLRFPKSFDMCIHCHESIITKKTGVLKELE
jgi:hypothetical protein